VRIQTSLYDSRLDRHSGKATVHGKQHAVNADFARHVVFISDLFDISERYVAGLVQEVTATHPHAQAVEVTEGVVALYHARRRGAVECLLLIFQAALASEDLNSLPTYARIDAFVRHHLLALPAAGKDTLAATLLGELSSVDRMYSNTLAAAQAAVSQTTMPSTLGKILSCLPEVALTFWGRWRRNPRPRHSGRPMPVTSTRASHAW
jgi:nuclear pore complex protein Nup205